MKRIAVSLLLVLLLATACTPSSPRQVTTPPAAPTATLPPAATTTPPAPSATPLGSDVPPTAAATATSGFVELVLGSQKVRLNATDMMVLTQPEFTLTGEAPEGTVISVNEDFTVVSADQRFAFWMMLEEGPNLVEIEASNAAGEDASLELVLIYEPAP